MPKIRIVTDSSAQFLSPSLVRQYGIVVIPLEVHMGGRVYREGVDLDAEHYFKKLHDPAVTELPSLVAPDPAKIAEVYAKLCREGWKILSLHLSRAFHPMWHQANTAAGMLLGRCDIQVVDSQTTSVGLAVLVEEAAKMIDDDMELPDIVRRLRSCLPRIYSMFYVETLDYLRRGGLLSESQSILGAMMGIKPFLTIEEGDLIAVEKVRTRSQAADKLVEFASEFDDMEKVALLHNGHTPSDFLRSLNERLQDEVGKRHYPTTLYHPSLACFLGPDAVGLFIYEHENRDFGQLGEEFGDID
jgi:DegV family protein with EDD domain